MPPLFKHVAWGRRELALRKQVYTPHFAITVVTMSVWAAAKRSRPSTPGSVAVVGDVHHHDTERGGGGGGGAGSAAGSKHL